MPSFDGVDQWRNRKPPHPAAMIFAYVVVAAGLVALAVLVLQLV